MGMFSKTCAKTHLPVLGPCFRMPVLQQVVVLLPSGSVLHGELDGYGRIDDMDLREHWDTAKMVLKRYYSGETYDQLGPPHDDPGQGHFHDEQQLRRWLANQETGFGFKSYAAYMRAYKKGKMPAATLR